MVSAKWSCKEKSHEWSFHYCFTFVARLWDFLKERTVASVFCLFIYLFLNLPTSLYTLLQRSCCVFSEKYLLRHSFFVNWGIKLFCFLNKIIELYLFFPLSPASVPTCLPSPPVCASPTMWPYPFSPSPEHYPWAAVWSFCLTS